MSIHPLEGTVSWAECIADIRHIENQIEESASTIQDPCVRVRFINDSGITNLQKIRGQLNDAFLPPLQDQRQLFQKVDAIRNTWREVLAGYRVLDSEVAREQAALAQERQTLKDETIHSAKFVASALGGVGGASLAKSCLSEVDMTSLVGRSLSQLVKKGGKAGPLIGAVAGAVLTRRAAEGAEQAVHLLEKASNPEPSTIPSE